MLAAAWVIVLLQLAGGVERGSCSDQELSAMLRAKDHLARGDAAAALRELEGGGQACTMRRVASLSTTAWREARALAPRGGAAELLGPVNAWLAELRALPEQASSLEVEYAETCIRAAIAAAQDERPEMELLLTHARDLSERLLARSRRAIWPHPYNVVAGELWFEVDRYADAVIAYDRAVRADGSPVALVGLARALARLDRIDEACAASRRVSNAAPPLRAAAASDLARCR